MSPKPAPLRLVDAASDATADEHTLDDVFAALADPVRRSILVHLEGRELLVSEIARNFDISLQAVSKHIQVLVRAGLVTQERTGRVSRCRLDAGPIFTAAVWLNRYSTYWQAQFDLLAAALVDIDERRRSPDARAKGEGGSRRKPARSRNK
jgi:DNA-binding transcriptional ArsR family regulator